MTAFSTVPWLVKMFLYTSVTCFKEVIVLFYQHKSFIVEEKERHRKKFVQSVAKRNWIHVNY